MCCAHCPRWRLIRSKKQRMTSLWKMAHWQITSKLKAVSQCGAAGGHCPSAALLRRADFGHGTPLSSESPSHGLTFHHPGTMTRDAVPVGTGRVPAPPHTSLSWKSGAAGTVRDYGQGLGVRGQLLDWPRQGSVPGPCHITWQGGARGGWCGGPRVGFRRFPTWHVPGHLQWEGTLARCRPRRLRGPTFPLQKAPATARPVGVGSHASLTHGRQMSLGARQSFGLSALPSAAQPCVSKWDGLCDNFQTHASTVLVKGKCRVVSSAFASTQVLTTACIRYLGALARSPNVSSTLQPQIRHLRHLHRLQASSVQRRFGLQKKAPCSPQVSPSTRGCRLDGIVEISSGGSVGGGGGGGRGGGGGGGLKVNARRVGHQKYKHLLSFSPPIQNLFGKVHLRTLSVCTLSEEMLRKVPAIYGVPCAVYCRALERK